MQDTNDYNQDNEHIEQIHLAMLFGQNSRLPAYYPCQKQYISDVATLKTTLILSLPGHKWIDFYLNKQRDNITSSANYLRDRIK